MYDPANAKTRHHGDADWQKYERCLDEKVAKRRAIVKPT